jgi:uncharacterized protein YbaP (TraB family)
LLRPHYYKPKLCSFNYTGERLPVCLYGETSVWKISGGDNALYIGGTVHILRESDYPLPEAFDAAFNESEMIIFETSVNDLSELLENEEIKDLVAESEWISTAADKNEKIFRFMDLLNKYSTMVMQNENVLNSMSDPSIRLTDKEQKILDQLRTMSADYQAMVLDEEVGEFVERAQNLTAKINESADIKYFLENFFNPDFQSLETILSEETYELLESLCEKYNYPIIGLKYFKPYMAYSVLSTHALTRFARKEGVDVFFMKKAKEYNKKVEYFETPEFQFNLIANLGIEYGEDYYAYLLRDFEGDGGVEVAFDQIVSSWRSGVEDDEVVSSMFYEMENFPIVYESMIANRNNSWLPVIEGYLKTPSIELVLVGTAHMYGPDGLLARLKERGYGIEQK